MAEWTRPDDDPLPRPVPPVHPTDYAAWQAARAPQPARSRAASYLLVIGLVALVVGYGLTALLTRHAWRTNEPRDGLRTSYTAYALDGSAPTPAAMTQTQRIVQSRVVDLGGAAAQVQADGAQVIVTSPGTDPGRLSALAQSGQIYVRPVIHAIPAQSTPSGALRVPANRSPPPSDLAQRIADEKALRQSSDQQIQLLALQFQATRCNDDDMLAGNDDPNSPLVACSQDGKQVYLLDKAIINGSEIDAATSAFDEKASQYTVDVRFNDAAATVWADFTAANVGTQTAFALDTRVLSAPVINEAIPGGRTQITGQFTAESARDLASALRHGALPVSLTFESSTPTTLPAVPGSTGLRVGLIGGGVVIALFAAFVAWYLVRHRRAPRE